MRVKRDNSTVCYGTDGVFQGPSLDSWSLGSHLQIQAAMRLLYYYPKESSSLITERLAKLDVKRTSARGKGSPGTDAESDARVRREVANGVRTDEFIKAVAWCPEPKIHEAVRTIFTTTDDIDILLAALSGIGDADRTLITSRLQTFLNAAPASESGAYGDGYNLLVAFAKRLGADAAPAFDSYLKDASAERAHSVAEALQSTRGEWAVKILLRLLGDKRPTIGYTYAISAKDQDARFPIRVCDAAAMTLCGIRPEVRFVLEGEYKDLDERIKTIQVQITGNRKK